jgi:lactoylglutathione lyase
MTEFTYDHVHLRSPNPDETAAYYERMFGAKIIKSVMSNGIERTDMNLGGVMVFIAQVREDADLAEKPEGSFVGLDHLGLRVRDIDQVCEALKAKGAEFTVEPKTIRRGAHRLCPRPAKRLDRDPRPRCRVSRLSRFP